MRNPGKLAGDFIYSARWALFPLGVGMLLILCFYVVAFFVSDIKFLVHHLRADLETLSL